MTIDFYTRVMGMPLIHALRVPPGVGVGAGNRGNPPYENLRHYFFDAGGDSMVAFFELPKGATQPADRNATAAMQHCSFTTTRAQFEVLHKRLLDHGVPVIGPINVGADSWSIYFFDPNGIRLELTAQLANEEQMARDSTVAHARLAEWTARKAQWRAERATGQAHTPLKPQANDRPEYGGRR